jgi:uncharacterized protein (DUF1800 family)
MRRVVLSGLLLMLAACGGGGGGGGGGSGGGGSGGGGAPVATATAEESARLLTQATFGPTDSDITTMTQSSLSAWVDNQLAMPVSASHLSFMDQRLAALQAANPAATLGANEFYQSFWTQAATSPDQLRQRVKFALSQIFVISLSDPNIDVRGAASYYDMLGANAFGNFRQLLEAVTLHPMMGVYLTYLANQRESGTRTPDENYAREVMQLMTIGLVQLNTDGSAKTDASGQPLATYSTSDIQGLAKVFTGISWYSASPSNSTFGGGGRNPASYVTPMIFYPNFHSISQKAFLGAVIGASATSDVAGDLKIAMDTLYNHPNVGPFIALRLIQQLVTSNPSPAYVSRVASAFNNNGSGVRGDMKAVIRAILLDPEARDMAAVGSTSFGKLREPVVRLSNWMRAFNATSQTGNWAVNSTSANTSLSESPLTSSSVFNFWRPGFVPPSTTQLGSRNLLAPEFQAVDEVTVAGYINTINSAINTGIGAGTDVRSAYTNEIAIADNPTALIDRLNRLLLYGQMSSSLRASVTSGINSINITGTQAQMDTAKLNRVKLAVLMVMASPEYLAQR